MTEILDLRPGIRVWFGGASWEVVALHGLEVTLRSGPSLQRVAVTEITAHAVAMAHKDDSFDPTAVVLSSLTTSQRHKLDVRAGHVRSALAAVNDDGTNLESVLAAKAKELDVSVRTLYRWIAGFRASGVAGLADTRIRSRYAVGVDPRWDATRLQVLDDYVEASTPTMGVVIDAVVRKLEASFGPGTVPLPGRPVRGRYRSGAAELDQPAPHVGGAHQVGRRPRGDARRAGEGVAPAHPGPDSVADQPHRPRLLPGDRLRHRDDHPGVDRRDHHRQCRRIRRPHGLTPHLPPRPRRRD